MESVKKDLQGKKLVRKVIKNGFMPLTLIEMIILHLSSPKASQKYKTLYLYQSQMDNEYDKAMIECNRLSSYDIYFKIDSTSDNERFYAFDKDFSGRVKMVRKWES